MPAPSRRGRSRIIADAVRRRVGVVDTRSDFQS
jgi:hypothetical protein